MNQINSDIYKDLQLLPLDLQGWNGNSKLFDELITKTAPEIIIEVGSWKGQSAMTMATSLKKINPNGKIYCVDTWLGAIEFWAGAEDTEARNLLQKNGYPQVYYQFLSNVVHCNCQDIILPLPMPSITAARYLQIKNVRSKLIYIDGSHEEDDVYMDLNYYYNLLENGGIMFGDDIWHSSVTLAVEKFTKEKNLSYTVQERDGGKFWIIQK